MIQVNQANAPHYRRFWLSELCRLRAAVRVGTASPSNASRERKTILREFATVLKQRRAKP